MSAYTYRGAELQDEADRQRWARARQNLPELTLEQIAVCAKTTRQRQQEALERSGLTLQFAEKTARYGGRKALLDAVLEIFERPAA